LSSSLLLPSLRGGALGRLDDEPLRLVRDRLPDERRDPRREPNGLTLGVVEAIAVAVRGRLGRPYREPLDESGLPSEELPQLVFIDPVPHWVSFRCKSELTPWAKSAAVSAASPSVAMCLGLLGWIQAARVTRPTRDARPPPDSRAAEASDRQREIGASR